MTFTQSIQTCFRKYFTFSGRGMRSEYWWFFLFLFLGSAVLGILDSALFGNDLAEVTQTNQSVGFSAAADGPLASIFSLVTLIPILSSGWRRMHDTGRSGLYLFYPLIAFIGLSTFIAMFGEAQVLNGDLSNVSGLFGVIVILSIIVVVLSPLIVLFWLSRPSQPGQNRYGPNPHEVLL